MLFDATPSEQAASEEISPAAAPPPDASEPMPAPGESESPPVHYPGDFWPDEPPPESLEGKTVWVVDSHSLIHQVFHALPEMTSPTGAPVGAVFGFTRDILYLWEEQRPDYLFCAFDLPGKTFRHDLYEPYKAHRPEMDVDLVPQIASIRRVLAALGVPAIGSEGYEADDVLATVARLVRQRGGRCFLVTADKDCRQLIGDGVVLYNIRKNAMLDRDALKADWGIEPAQVVDYQALVGDSTDNVPGVPLIGPKLAQQLLEKYGTLENILDHADEVSGEKRKQNLREGRPIAMLSRDLVRLVSDVPCAIPWSRAKPGQADWPRVASLFREFGFRGLSAKAEQHAKETPSETHVAPPPQPEDVCHVVDTPEALAQLAAALAGHRTLAVDLETTAISPRWADVVGLVLAWREDEAWYVPVAGPPGERVLDRRLVFDTLRPVLENPAVEKVGQNLKYDQIVLRAAGIELRGIAFDTMVASYLLEAGQRSHRLDDVAQRYLGYGKHDITELIGSGKNQRRMDDVPVRRVADYAGLDVLIPLRLRPLLEAQLKRAELTRLFLDLEMPLVETLSELEYVGITVDRTRLAELAAEFRARLEALEAEIHTMAGHPFNIASPKQLQKVLFEEQGLPVLAKTKTGPSTDAEVLDDLARLHPLPEKIVEHRQYAKLLGTYVDALPELIHPQTGRVHTSFHQDVAATGRLSSRDPNLQNIPVRTESGRAIRSAFIPNPSDWTLLAADYSQIELRVLAHFSADPQLCGAFERDEDIHARVAAQISGVALDQVTAEMRRRAKVVNFGVLYGQGSLGLSKQLGTSQEEAARFIDAYFQGYPGVGAFVRKVLRECAETGQVKTILGRRRAIQGVRADADRHRNLAERTAVNTVVQGSAADLIKLAMLDIHRALAAKALAAKALAAGELQARMLLQIHDELVFEVSIADRDRLAALVRDRMANAYPLNVPLKVDVKTGPNWADMKPWEPACT